MSMLRLQISGVGFLGASPAGAGSPSTCRPCSRRRPRASCDLHAGDPSSRDLVVWCPVSDTALKMSVMRVRAILKSFADIGTHKRHEAFERRMPYTRLGNTSGKMCILMKSLHDL